MDADEFAELVEAYRRELRVHCYRMLGSLEESEDLVQETFLRAWKHRDTSEGRATLRAWLYRIATNACLDALDGRQRRVLPQHLQPPSDPSAPQQPRTDIPWLQPYPDQLWEPEAAAVERETIELAFLAAIQHLPPRQRAVLILRDVLGWPAKQVAATLDTTVASANSGLQRARATLREHLPRRRLDWTRPTEPTDDERAVLRRYMDAVEAGDIDAVAELLAEDVRTAMPPFPLWFQGRDAVRAALTASWDPTKADYIGRLRVLATRANAQPALAGYVRSPDDPDHRPFAIGVMRIELGLITEITAFHDPALFPAFGLPATLPPAHR